MEPIQIIILINVLAKYRNDKYAASIKSYLLNFILSIKLFSEQYDNFRSKM